MITKPAERRCLRHCAPHVLFIRPLLGGFLFFVKEPHNADPGRRKMATTQTNAATQNAATYALLVVFSIDERIAEALRDQ